MIEKSEFKCVQKENTLQFLKALQCQCNDEKRFYQFTQNLSLFFWEYDKLRIYFVNHKSSLDQLHQSYNSLLDLRSHLKMVA